MENTGGNDQHQHYHLRDAWEKAAAMFDDASLDQLKIVRRAFYVGVLHGPMLRGMMRSACFMAEFKRDLADDRELTIEISHVLRDKGMEN